MPFAADFSTYFGREVAQKAAKSLSNGVEIEFHVDSEVFTFTRENGSNAVHARAARDPHLVFTLTPQAAQAILSDPSEDIGQIGVNILKLVVDRDPARKVSVQFKAGFLTLFTKGYLGVLSAGGSGFASYLASRGLSGMDAIKAALKKMKS